MSLKLEDLIGKKKEAAQILDLSKATATNADEYRRIMEKVPDFKMKPEKIKPEDVKIQDRPKRWTRRAKAGKYQFADPVPNEMQSLRLVDLCSVPIQWNMLTTLRPKTKLDEEYFSRLVELGKLELATKQREKKTPVTFFLKKMKNRAGVVESRFLSCTECGEDFCQREACCRLQYDDFRRDPLIETVGKKVVKDRGRAKMKTKGLKKKRGKSRKGRSKFRNRASSEGSKSREASRSRKENKSRGGSSSRSRESSKNRETVKGRPRGRRLESSSRGESKEGEDKVGKNKKQTQKVKQTPKRAETKKM